MMKLDKIIFGRSKVTKRERVLEPIEAIKNLSPYSPTSSMDTINNRKQQKPYKLDWNEATILPSPKVLKAMNEYLSGMNHLNWYPEILSKSLKTKIGEYVDLPESNIIVTNGSDDALELVNKVFVSDGDRVIVPIPTYTHFYVHSGQRNAEIVKISSPDVFKTNLEGILKAITNNTKIIYIVNPNNPTGVMYNEHQIRTILTHAAHSIVIVDEAYYEFAGISMAHLVKEYDNIVVTRTFSKSFGLAAQRIGYMLASNMIIENCLKIFNPKSVNRMGQIAAEAALDDIDHLNSYVKSVTDAKYILKRYFLSRGIEFRTTPANYVLIQHSMPKELIQLLQDEGVYVRDRTEQMDG
jgi:histidinol-phosphate aminotransferase